VVHIVNVELQRVRVQHGRHDVPLAVVVLLQAGAHFGRLRLQDEFAVQDGECQARGLVLAGGQGDEPRVGRRGAEAQADLEHLVRREARALQESLVALHERNYTSDLKQYPLLVT